MDPTATVAAKSWAFVSFSMDGKRRVGAVPAGAVSDAGIDVVQLEAGRVVAADEMVEAVHEIWRERGMKEPSPPPRGANDKKKPCTANTSACAREQAIEQARAAGILGEERAYPTCGDPMGMLHGYGDDPRPPELAPVHATACPVVTSSDTTGPFAALVLADRELPAVTVMAPFVGDSGVLLARFGVTTAMGEHARTLAVQIGQNTGPGPSVAPPRRDHVLVLDANADPIKLVNAFPNGDGDAWIWISGNVKYQRLVELIQRLSALAIAPITITLEDPRPRVGRSEFIH